MGIDDMRKNFNKKLDDFGDSAMSKIRQQREANASTTSSNRVGLQDRMSMFKGQDPRWEKDVNARQSGEPGSTSTIVPERSRVPPPPRSAMAGSAAISKGAPPPPPMRRGTSGSIGAAATSAHTPALPPRMQNEDGTSHPPPPYPPTSTSYAEHQYPTSNGSGHIEFSRFTHEDKLAFFDLLDEYFDQKSQGVR